MIREYRKGEKGPKRGGKDGEIWRKIACPL